MSENEKYLKKILRNYRKNRSLKRKYYRHGLLKEEYGNYRVIEENFRDINYIIDEVEIVEYLMNDLDDNEREVIILKYIGDKSVTYIMDKLYISRSTMYRRIKSALDKMLDGLVLIKKIYPDHFI